MKATKQKMASKEELNESQINADNYLKANIAEAKKDHDKMIEVYTNYVFSAHEKEERERRIHLFRCGGYLN